MTIDSLVKLAKGEDEDDIEFASFTCNRCEAAITWPTIVSHVCLRVVWHEETFRKSTTTMIGFLPSILGDRYSSVELAAPFDVDRIKHDAEQSKRLQTLVDNFADASLFENEEPTHDSLMALGYRFKPAGSPSYTMYPDTQLWSWEQIVCHHPVSLWVLLIDWSDQFSQ